MGSMAVESQGLVTRSPAKRSKRLRPYDTLDEKHAPASSYIAQKLRNAYMLYTNQKYSDAQAECEEIQRLNPNKTDNLVLLGACHFQQGNLSQCVDINTKILALDNNLAEAHGNLGSALKLLGRLEEAKKCFMKALALKPSFRDAYSNLASIHLQQNNVAEALRLLNASLSFSPDVPETYSSMGDIWKSQGDHVKAKMYYQTAVKVNPSYHIAWHNLAALLETEGDVLNAVECYKRAIKVKQNFAEAHCNLGNVYKKLGQTELAEQSYQSAILHNPQLAVAYGNLGSLYYEKNDKDKAMSLYTKALEIQPTFPDACNNLGNVLRDRGELDRAVELYQKALEQQPGHPHALNNLGNAYKDLGKWSEAFECYMAAVQAMPTSPAAHSNIATMYKEQGDTAKAIFHYQEVIRLRPTFAAAYSNLGNIYKDMSRFDDAIHYYKLAISIDPNMSEAYANIGSAFKDCGRVEEAIVNYRKTLLLNPEMYDSLCNLAHSLMFVCSYEERDAIMEQLHAVTRFQISKQLTPSVQPFHALVYPLPLDLITEISKSYGDRCVASIASDIRNFSPDQIERLPGERIRVGYVSSDFVNHPLAHLMQSTFGMHDRSRFEVICFSLSKNDESEYYKKISTEVEKFIDVSHMTSIDIARLINSMRIHVLFNLNGYTKGARNEIFAFQPSPVQVSYMGFCGTMGASFIQYLVTDPVVSPLALESLYTEKLVHMPHSYFVNDHKQTSLEVLDPSSWPSRSQYGIPEDKIVLCNFNQLYKIDPLVLDVWCRLLHNLPETVLWLLRFPVAGEAGIRKEARARGITDDRIIFTDVANKSEHIRRGVCADLFLDSYQCNAHTTGCDILWSGTPIVTAPQEKMSCRVAASLVNALGCQELIVDSLEDYEEWVTSKVSSSSRELVNGRWVTVGALGQLRAEIEQKRMTEPLFDTERWVRNLERGIERMWEIHESGNPPQHIKVEDVFDGLCTPEPPISDGSLAKLESSVGCGPELDKELIRSFGKDCQDQQAVCANLTATSNLMMLQPNLASQILNLQNGRLAGRSLNALSSLQEKASQGGREARSLWGNDIQNENPNFCHPLPLSPIIGNIHQLHTSDNKFKSSDFSSFGDASAAKGNDGVRGCQSDVFPYQSCSGLPQSGTLLGNFLSGPLVSPKLQTSMRSGIVGNFGASGNVVACLDHCVPILLGPKTSCFPSSLGSHMAGRINMPLSQEAARAAADMPQLLKQGDAHLSSAQPPRPGMRTGVNADGAFFPAEDSANNAAELSAQELVLNEGLQKLVLPTTVPGVLQHGAVLNLSAVHPSPSSLPNMCLPGVRPASVPVPLNPQAITSGVAVFPGGVGKSMLTRNVTRSNVMGLGLKVSPLLQQGLCLATDMKMLQTSSLSVPPTALLPPAGPPAAGRVVCNPSLWNGTCNGAWGSTNPWNLPWATLSAIPQT